MSDPIFRFEFLNGDHGDYEFSCPRNTKCSVAKEKLKSHLLQEKFIPSELKSMFDCQTSEHDSSLKPETLPTPLRISSGDSDADFDADEIIPEEALKIWKMRWEHLLEAKIYRVVHSPKHDSSERVEVLEEQFLCDVSELNNENAEDEYTPEVYTFEYAIADSHSKFPLLYLLIPSVPQNKIPFLFPFQTMIDTVCLDNGISGVCYSSEFLPEGRQQFHTEYGSRGSGNFIRAFSIKKEDVKLVFGEITLAELSKHLDVCGWLYAMIDYFETDVNENLYENTERNQMREKIKTDLQKDGDSFLLTEEERIEQQEYEQINEEQLIDEGYHIDPELLKYGSKQTVKGIGKPQDSPFRKAMLKPDGIWQFIQYLFVGPFEADYSSQPFYWADDPDTFELIFEEHELRSVDDGNKVDYDTLFPLNKQKFSDTKILDVWCVPTGDYLTKGAKLIIMESEEHLYFFLSTANPLDYWEVGSNELCFPQSVKGALKISDALELTVPWEAHEEHEEEPFNWYEHKFIINTGQMLSYRYHFEFSIGGTVRLGVALVATFKRRLGWLWNRFMSSRRDHSD